MAALYTITFGGWYQRTTLHLTEVYGFLSKGFTKLDLSKEKLEKLHQGLNLKSVSREIDYLEYVLAKTKDDIIIRYYEDGLYILECQSNNIERAKEKLETYFEESFEPAINFLFSLGAPTPKVLANIKSTHQLAISTIDEKLDENSIKKEFGEIYSKITSAGITVYKTEQYIIVITDQSRQEKIRYIIETQIFFREFKDQLEKYLNIHRKVWEEISNIKEQQFIKGSDVENTRATLDQYQKTIDLIDSRINQMATYIKTRASISKELKIETYLNSLFQYKFEILMDTHSYIKEIWVMTKNYLSSAIEVIREIADKSINQDIRSLQIITGVGAISGVLGYLANDSLPTITPFGFTYLILLALIIWPANFVIRQIYKNQKYKLTFPEQAKNI